MEPLTNADVIDIAKKQKIILWLILASLATFAFRPLWLVVALVSIVVTYQLTKALKLRAPWAWCAGMLIPLVSLILLLVVNGKATRAIRAKGVRVGLMGASRRELEQLNVAGV